MIKMNQVLIAFISLLLCSLGYGFEIKITAYPGLPQELVSTEEIAIGKSVFLNATVTNDYPSGLKGIDVDSCETDNYQIGVEFSLKQLSEEDVYADFELVAQITSLYKFELDEELSCGKVYVPTLRYVSVTDKVRLITNNPVVYMLDHETQIVLQLMGKSSVK